MIFDPSSLGNRGVLRGAQCVCGQHWPDFQRTDHAEQFRTECCGSLYQLVTTDGLQTLSLVEDALPRIPCPVCGGAGGEHHWHDKRWQICDRCQGEKTVRRMARTKEAEG